MSGRVDRELIAQLAIILALTVGGWLTFVQPAMTEVLELESQMAAAPAGVVATGVDSIEAFAARLASMSGRIDEINSRNALAQQSARLYGLIMNEAARRDVVVHRLQPGGEVRQAGADRMVINQIDMTAEGTYERVADFLDAVMEIDGFIRSRSLSLTPLAREGRQLVTARFQCEILRFDCSEVLAQMEAPTDADG